MSLFSGSQNKENMDKHKFLSAEREHNPFYSAGKPVNHCHPSTALPSARVRCSFVLWGHNNTDKACEENAAPANPLQLLLPSNVCLTCLGKESTLFCHPCSFSSLCWRNPWIKDISQIFKQWCSSQNATNFIYNYCKYNWLIFLIFQIICLFTIYTWQNITESHTDGVFWSVSSLRHVVKPLNSSEMEEFNYY